jgi:hypothetical protein
LLPDQPVPDARRGPYPFRAVRPLPQCPAQAGDLDRQIAVFDDGARPGRLHQVGPADVAVGAGERLEDGEGAVAQCNGPAARQQHLGAAVEDERPKTDLTGPHGRHL